MYLVSIESNRKCRRSSNLKKLTYAAGRRTPDKSVSDKLIKQKALSHLIRHAWDTVDLFYPRALGHLIHHAWDTVDLLYTRALSRLIHAWDTVDLFYPRALGHLIHHAWDTVDLFYPRALGHLIHHAWDTVDLFYPGPLVTSYIMPGIQWTYSIPGPSSPHTSCLGYS